VKPLYQQKPISPIPDKSIAQSSLRSVSVLSYLFI